MVELRSARHRRASLGAAMALVCGMASACGQAATPGVRDDGSPRSAETAGVSQPGTAAIAGDGRAEGIGGAGAQPGSASSATTEAHSDSRSTTTRAPAGAGASRPAARPAVGAPQVAAPDAAELARGEAALARLAPMGDAELRAQFEESRKEGRPPLRRFEQDLAAAYQRAMQFGDAGQLATVERALRATLGDLATRSPQDLAGRVTQNGSADPVNFEMRDAALHLAMLARVTRDATHADRAAALLAAFARAIPAWPIWTPFSAAREAKIRARQDDAQAFRSEFAAGLWGDWIYMDLLMGAPLVQASAILAPTGAVERAGARDAVRAMLDLHVATQRKFNPGPDYSNMDAFQIRGFLEFGRNLPDPELVHEGVRRLRNIYRTNFYPDGWWHEGAASYHVDLQTALRDVARALPVGYSDPPGFRSAVDGERFDNFDLAASVRGPSDRADAVTRQLTLPDRTLLAVHDTQWPQAAPAGAAAPTRSFLFGALGQGSLVSGRDDGYAMATLHWSPSGSHAHADALNLNLWAKDTEAISETQYMPRAGDGSTRAWNASTAGHATVVVNGVNQAPTGPRGSRLRAPRPEDAIPGIPDWRWRWTTSNAQDGGDLRLFNTAFPNVQVMEADATRAYDKATGTTMYRRTVALVRIDDADTYVVDIFRVKGAASCDYMLHAALQLAQTLKVSVPLQPAAGTEHEQLRNLRRASADGAWLAAFEMANGVSLLSFVAPAPGTTVIQADGPAMRRGGTAPFLIARRQGPDATFVVVHHVVRGSTPRVQGIELIPTECPDCVALKVRVGARTDTVVSCADRRTLCRVPGGIEVRGLFAHVAQGPTADDQWAFLVDGDLLRTPEALIEGEVSHSGTLRGTLRAEAGDRVNGFVMDEAIPEGRIVSGCPIIVDLAGEMTWAYRAATVGRRDGATVVETRDEPGLIVRPGEIKQTYFPGWGFRGDARYRIPGFAIAQPGGEEAPRQTGTARVEWRPPAAAGAPSR